MNVKTEWRTFDADELQELLEGSANYRELNSNHRNSLLAEMEAGRWKDNGQPLLLDDDGNLIDGQHRLSAYQMFLRARPKAAPIRFLVVSGLPTDAQHTVDVGRRRSFADYLKHHGVKYATNVGAITRGQAKMMMAPKGSRLWVLTSHPGGRGEDGRMVAKVPTVLQQIDAYKRNRGAIEEWAAIAGTMAQKSGIGTPGLIGAILFQFAKEDSDAAKLFADYLATGSGLKERDPILVLRNMLLKERTAIARRRPTHIAAMVVKAWVAWMNGDTLSLLKWNAGGAHPEEFPDHRVKQLAAAV